MDLPMPNGLKLTLGLLPMVCGVLGLAGCTMLTGAPRRAGIQVIAHRGSSAQAPENTLAAFEAAARARADWFELDCAFSRDRQVVVLHDATLERTTSGKGRLADHTLAELQALDAGTWFAPSFGGERLPTLEQALALARRERIGVYIEIKSIEDESSLSPELLGQYAGVDRLDRRQLAALMTLLADRSSANQSLANAVIEAVEHAGMARQVVIQSFSPVVCAVVRAQAPQLRIELLGSRDAEHPERWTQFVRWGDLLGVDGMNPAANAVDAAFIDRCHRQGMTVSVWTVDAEADMEKYARMGVDGIITNQPERCRKVLERIGKHAAQPQPQPKRE